MTRFAAALACVWSAACASAGLGQLPPSPVPGWEDAVQWGPAGDEAAALLSGYLQVDTTNPPGNEAAGAKYLAAALAREGIDAELVELEPGRSSLIARLASGGTEPPLCLLSHLDVVSSDPSAWDPERGPLSGALADGQVWGRGALDMKGMGILELLTLLWLKRLEVPLRRDVVLLAVPDEEVSNRGIRQLVEQHWDRIGCSHLVNEGSIGVEGLLFPEQTVFPISVAEKGVLWLRLSAHGKGGHGSTPLADSAPSRLLAALERVRAREPEVRVHDAMWSLLAEAGAEHGGLAGFVLARPLLVRLLAMDDLLANPVVRAALTDTAYVTHVETPRGEPNVVPEDATALVDCRLLPGTRAADLTAELRALVADLEIEIEVVQAMEANESPVDDPLFTALARQALAIRPGAVAGPVLSPGFTDSIYVRERGVHAYGFVPFVVTVDELRTMHGARERVSVSNLRTGLRSLLLAVLEFAARPGATPGGPAKAPAPQPPIRLEPAPAPTGPAGTLAAADDAASDSEVQVQVQTADIGSPIAGTSPLASATGGPGPLDAAPAAPTSGTRWYAVPNFAFDTDDGVGFGVRGELALDAPGVEPYESAYVAHLFFTTRGYMHHRLRYDRVGFGPDEALRFTAHVAWRQWLNDGYWGIGNGTTRERATTGELDPDDPARKRYRYTLLQPFAHLTLRARLAGPWQVFGALDGKWSEVRTYAGSLLAEERPPGIDGGLGLQLVGGVLYDTRRPEAAPDGGVLLELSGRWAPPVGAGDFGGVLGSVRAYLKVAEPLVLAGRLMAEWLFGDVPFYEMVHWGGLWPVTGFGGFETVRGLPFGRFRAPGKAVLNSELRIDVVEHTLGGERFRWQLAPFADVGVVFGEDGLTDAPAPRAPLHPGVGAGVRVVYAQAFVGRVDAALAVDPVREPDGRVHNESNFGFYVVFDHAF